MGYQEIAAALTKRGEACRLIGYPDQGGIATWGWGHTGPEVHVGQAITQQQADIDFARDQAVADAALQSHTRGLDADALSDHERAALLDFCFNTGGGPLGKDEWNLWKVVRAGDLAAVPGELNRFIFVHINGVATTSRGLKNRRAAEIVLWNTADVDAAVTVACAGGEQACSASTRELPTPPEPVAPKALARTSLAVKVGTVLSGAGAWASQAVPHLSDKAQAAHDIVAAHSDMPYAGPIGSTLAAAVVVCGVAALFIHEAQQKAAKV